MEAVTRHGRPNGKGEVGVKLEILYRYGTGLALRIYRRKILT
jgi:hypothetical protein